MSIWIFISMCIKKKWKNKYISYNDGLYENRAYLNEKKFIRENDEYIITIDFINKEMIIFLKNENIKTNMDIECSFISTNNEITLKYKVDTNNMKLIIHLL